ncbi:cytochrome c/c1 heme lyase-domain-containing protein [Melampsora americana]|nr:cytochrome c/c1 heme lyase-domain-containing protein [Melampsora americana]
MWPFGNSNPTSSPQPATCPLGHDSSSKRSTPRDHPTQLPTDREVSSIPRFREDSEEQANWVYPSPAQFYSALARKKQHSPEVNDMYTVVPIHNAVNERVWQQVLEWEANYGQGAFDRWPRSGKSGPMLSSFRGRPNDRSPRAWIKVLSGYQPPFDRHDWEVVRPTEARMRYVIDFYPGRTYNPETGSPATSSSSPPNLAFYLDVRPALDNWEGIRMRLLKTWDEFKSGFTSTQPENSIQIPSSSAPSLNRPDLSNPQDTSPSQ